MDYKVAGEFLFQNEIKMKSIIFKLKYRYREAMEFCSK